MNSILNRALWWIIAAGALLTTIHASAAGPLAVVKPTLSCESLVTVSFEKALGEKVLINSAKILKTTKGNFCKVTATIAPAIGVEVALPQDKWTQRFLQVGCGGMCGSINLSLSNASGCLPAMSGEFTVAATNMGHEGGMMDGTWAEDPQKRIDFAYRANHLTALLAKELIQTYYGQQQKYAYFMGCSDGGREALMEAQRYPDDFDGISAGAPAAFFQFQNSFFHGWNVAANLRSDGTAILLKDRLPILHKAVIDHCPTLSGVNDGILENPYACKFSPDWVKTCAENQADRTHCLTLEEMGVAEKLYRGAYDETGRQFVPAGLPLGSELRWPVPESAQGHSMSEMMVLPALQSVLLAEGKQNIHSMRDFPLNAKNFESVAKLAPLYNATNTNLKPYMDRGGKLIMWHGLADDSISPAISVAYYRGVVKTMGQASVNTFMRLFLLPGVGHCGGGEGFDQIDLLTPLMAWTEKDKTPESLVAGQLANANRKMPELPQGGIKTNSGQGMPPMMANIEKKEDSSSAAAHFHGVQMSSIPLAKSVSELKATRPVYPYPFIAKYTGKGSAEDAKNYIPVKSDAYQKLTMGSPATDYIGPDNQKDYVIKEGRLVTVN